MSGQSELLDILDTDELLALVNRDMKEERLEGALIKLKLLSRREDRPVEALAVRGRLYAQLGLFDKAKRSLKEYLDVVPDAIIERFQYGMAHYDSGDLAEALRLFHEVAAAKPDHPPALFYIALAHAQRQENGEAFDMLGRLFEVANEDNLFFKRGKELEQNLRQRAGAHDNGDLDPSAPGVPGGVTLN
jgi:tetratricopeptide (TPR) repeat protein